ncbi:MAG: hypothetical protein KGJ13_04685 [Patescibacteria group bacterium]|nr:hypothetical protein [Patescibacteria group bacterium]
MNEPTTSVREPVKVIADILASELDLDDQHIAMAYQKYDIPNDGLFVVLGYLGPSSVVANQNYFDSAINSEVQETLMLHRIQIDLMSMAPDNSARIRKEEIPMALRSFYSQRLQSQYKIGVYWNTGDFADTTSLEETAMLNRYTMRVFVNALHRKVKTTPYLDNFPISVTAPPTTTVNVPTTEAFNV